MGIRVAIDALGIHRYGGGRSSILNLLLTLLEIDKKNHYDLFLSQYEGDFANNNHVNQIICPFGNRFITRLWLQLFVLFRQGNWDLFHFTKNLGTFGHSIPTIVTIHDMTTILYPDIFPIFDVWYWRYIERFTVHNADKLIAVSKTTAQDIAEIYSVSPDKIKVIYHGVASHFHPSKEETIERVKKKYSLSNDYLLYVGHIDRKKNLPMLIRAYAEVIRSSAFEGKLVIAGEEYQKTREITIYRLIEELNLEEKITLTGPVLDIDLPATYSGATATLFPSYHEGFGLVGLEAMSCGSPLIASDAGAIREVTADAALIVSSNEPADFAAAILEVLKSPSLQEDMRKKGLARAAEFTWENAAKDTLALYENCSR